MISVAITDIRLYVKNGSAADRNFSDDVLGESGHIAFYYFVWPFAVPWKGILFRILCLLFREARIREMISVYNEILHGFPNDQKISGVWGDSIRRIGSIID